MRTLTQYQVEKFDWMIEEIAKDLEIPKEKAIKFAAALFHYVSEQHSSREWDARRYYENNGHHYNTRSPDPEYNCDDTLLYVAAAAAFI